MGSVHRKVAFSLLKPRLTPAHPSVRGTLVSSRYLPLELLRLPGSPRNCQLPVPVCHIRRGKRGKAGEGTQRRQQEGKRRRGDSLGAAWPAPPKTPPPWQRGRTLHRSAGAESISAKGWSARPLPRSLFARADKSALAGGSGGHSGGGAGLQRGWARAAASPGAALGCPLVPAASPGSGRSRQHPLPPEQGHWPFRPRFAPVCGPARGARWRKTSLSDC